MNRFMTLATLLVVLSLSAGCSRHESSASSSDGKESKGAAPNVATVKPQGEHASGEADGDHGAEQQRSTESAEHHASKPVRTLPAGANKMCPVMPDEKADPATFVEFDGKRIYVCCKKCRQRVADDPAAWYAKAYSAGQKN